MGLKKRRERRGKIFPLSSLPLPLSFFFCYQDSGRDQCTSEFPLKNTPALKGIDIGVISAGTEVN